MVRWRLAWLCCVFTLCATVMSGSDSMSAWRLVGQAGGWPRAVAVQGVYAYIGVGPRVVVVGISDPANPHEEGASELLPHNVRDVALGGEHAYVAAGAGGLRVLEVSDPAEPREVGTWTSPGFARGVAVSGSFAYVADGPLGLRVVDVSDPTRPREIGAAFVVNDAQKVRVEGRYAYVAAAGAGVLIADVADPAHPVELGSARVPGYAYDLAVGGGHAWVAAGWEGLQVVSVADPVRPTLVGSLALPGWAFGIAVANGQAFVADTLNGLRVVDISDPRKPVASGSLEWTRALAFSVALSGNLALVADARWGIHTIDVSDPKKPVRAGFFGVLAHASSVFIKDDLAYVAGGYGGFHILDLSDLSRPRELGSWDGESYVTHVWVDGQYAYVTSILGLNYGVHVLDVSDPAHPRLVRKVPSSVGQVHDVVVVNGVAYGTGESELVVLDVSDPTRASEKYVLPLVQGSAFDVPLLVQGNRAFVALHGVHILDLSEPFRPVRIGLYQPRGVEGGLTVRDDVVYLSTNVLWAVDISRPENPVEIGSFNGPGFPTGMTAQGSELFVAAGNAGVNLFDITDPRNPALTGSTKTFGHARGVVAKGDTLFVADENGGLVILHRGELVNGGLPPSRGNGSPSHAPAIVAPAPAPALHHEAACIVTSVADAGAGTLRTCLQNVRNNGSVTFDPRVFPPEQPATIRLQSALPVVSVRGVTIAASDAGVILDGSQTPPGTGGLGITAPLATIRGLQIVGFPGVGIAIFVDAPGTTTIGGDQRIGRGPLGQGNLVSGNGGDGINVASNDCVISGNLIGTTLDGKSALPNWIGINMENATGNLIRDNVISGNTNSGVWMTDWAAGFNSFVGNMIGADITGLAPLGNGHGMGIDYLGFNRIGGTDPEERNVISGNAGRAIWVNKGTGNLVLGNLIGVAADGTTPMLNHDGGIVILDEARETVLGGATDREGNVIASGGSAVEVQTDFNVVIGNAIGVDRCGRTTIEGFHGISTGFVSHTIVQRNRVANQRVGVAIEGGISNTVRRNAIWLNGSAGIALIDVEPATAPPLITRADRSSVSGTTCARCVVEIFSDDGSQGQVFEGSVIADATGTFVFEKRGDLSGPNITATATDVNGNTSEFSNGVPVDTHPRRRPARRPCM